MRLDSNRPSGLQNSNNSKVRSFPVSYHHICNSFTSGTNGNQTWPPRSSMLIPATLRGMFFLFLIQPKGLRFASNIILGFKAGPEEPEEFVNLRGLVIQSSNLFGISSVQFSSLGTSLSGKCVQFGLGY